VRRRRRRRLFLGAAADFVWSARRRRRQFVGAPPIHDDALHFLPALSCLVCFPSE